MKKRRALLVPGGDTTDDRQLQGQQIGRRHALGGRELLDARAQRVLLERRDLRE